jgi:DNA phosphorothioation-dependent restriction protein DptG
MVFYHNCVSFCDTFRNLSIFARELSLLSVQNHHALQHFDDFAQIFCFLFLQIDIICGAWYHGDIQTQGGQAI